MRLSTYRVLDRETGERLDVGLGHGEFTATSANDLYDMLAHRYGLARSAVVVRRV